MAAHWVTTQTDVVGVKEAGDVLVREHRLSELCCYKLQEHRQELMLFDALTMKMGEV